MNFVHRVFCHALLLAALAAPGSSFADAGDVPVHAPRWACWYSSADLTVQCLLSQVPTENLEIRAAEVARAANPRLPAIVQSIWGRPQELAGDRITVPLNSIPFEMAFVELLARSAMCGVRPDCSVIFDPNRDGHAAIRAAALESGAIESEVMTEVLAQGFEIPVAEKPAGRAKRKKAAVVLASTDF